MHKVLQDLLNIHQGGEKVEEENRKRLNQAFYRCGNAHRSYEKITIYIDVLYEIIATVFTRYGEGVHRREMTFESM